MDSKRLLRAVVRSVHPDLFVGYPFEQERNSESLKALNSYADDISKGIRPRTQTVEFWIKNGDALTRIQALLPDSGTLGPLFLAFGLITQDELVAGAGSEEIQDVNFLQWLQETVTEAISMQVKHENLKQRIRESRANIQYKYGLNSLKVGISEYSVGLAEQQRQLEALGALDATLAALGTVDVYNGALDALDFSGLDLHVHHPDGAPMIGMHPMSGSYPGGPDGPQGCYINESGVLVCIADRHTLPDAIRQLDLSHARVLARVKHFWDKRVRDLTPIIKQLLGVENVWCDTRTEQNTQNFVLWAGYLLEQREDVAMAVGDRRFSFSMLVHSDEDAQLIDWNSNSSVLQVRSDCTPKHLVEFLVSEIGTEADAAALAVQKARLEEQQLLEQIRATYGAKHVIQVCSSQSKDLVMAGARRLLAAAEFIKSTVDLTGASLAIDECYEVWGSGFISIPYNFELSELQPRLVKLLAAHTSAAASAHHHAAHVYASNGRATGGHADGHGGGYGSGYAANNVSTYGANNGGSSGDGNGSSNSSSANGRVAVTACVRSHGVSAGGAPCLQPRRLAHTLASRRLLQGWLQRRPSIRGQAATGARSGMPVLRVL